MSVPTASNEMVEALKFYADPKNWWNQNVDDRLRWHNANLDGSMERLGARPGAVEHPKNFVHQQFYPDCGHRARKALSHAEAAISSAPPSVEGWQWVPVEPMQEQVLAGWEEQNHWCLVNGDSEEVRAIYRAMLAASPTQPDAWRPVEAAPKDGTAVHLGFWYQGRLAQYIGFNDGRGWMENSRTFFPSHMQGWFNGRAK